MKMLRVLIPDDWREAIENQRGDLTVSEFVRQGIVLRLKAGTELSEMGEWGGTRDEAADGNSTEGPV